MVTTSAYFSEENFEVLVLKQQKAEPSLSSEAGATIQPKRVSIQGNNTLKLGRYSASQMNLLMLGCKKHLFFYFTYQSGKLSHW